MFLADIDTFSPFKTAFTVVLRVALVTLETAFASYPENPDNCGSPIPCRELSGISG
ncbi:MAG: hypothetical protein E6468_02385 [Varibaculum cambriense]|uniref:Uncharacterized protein n=1 Tax=Varibaculum cambriense TaxID=184870 RepID=A0AB34X1P9_9ACTO|nr:hypothetical protein [Varibaculum cambriense]KXB81911.1 hypothetical protein HMPREF1862_00341 [Varibaculum cambriense]MDU6680682.1 hypothetical protein [Varibaculum cambriense]